MTRKHRACQPVSITCEVAKLALLLASIFAAYALLFP